jgi:hypothetical protein
MGWPGTDTRQLDEPLHLPSMSSITQESNRKRKWRWAVQYMVGTRAVHDAVRGIKVLLLLAPPWHSVWWDMAFCENAITVI